MPSMDFNTKKLCVHTLMLPFLYKGLWSIGIIIILNCKMTQSKRPRLFLSPTNLIVNWHHFGQKLLRDPDTNLLKGIANPSKLFMISTFNYLDAVYLWSSPRRCYEINCQPWTFTWQQKCIKIWINVQF